MPEVKGIAILGWGSLLWDAYDSFDASHGPWKNGGPSIQLEFSRISHSRQGALTLVIDELNGRLCKVAYCVSKRAKLDDVIEDLRRREGTSKEKIGYLDADGNHKNADPANKIIKQWADDKKLKGVVWTNLESNFANELKTSFSMASAISYLQGLGASGKVKAAEYIWRAPSFIKTPLRDALEIEPWFKDARETS